MKSDIKEIYDSVGAIDLRTHEDVIKGKGNKILKSVYKYNYFHNLDELFIHYISENIDIRYIDLVFIPYTSGNYLIEVYIDDNTNTPISYTIGVGDIDDGNDFLLEDSINHRIKILKRSNTIDKLLDINI